MARAVTVDGGGLPQGALLVRRVTAREELGRPFEVELELLSLDERLSPGAVAGQAMGVHLELPGAAQRHLHGLVVRFGQAGWSNRRAVYRASLRPSLWLLGRRAGCRMFQARSVPEIVQAILGEYGFPFELTLSGTYPPREYVVQYRESDLDFVSRLMEQEGIYYWFRHEAGKHTMVIADDLGAHHRVAGQETIPFYPPQEGERRERDHVDTWNASGQLDATAVALRDYDFTRPRAQLEVKRADGGGHTPELEVYDYPGGYLQPGEGERYARTRLEERVAARERAEGAGNVRAMTAGMLFALREHPRADQNREYLVLSVTSDLTLTDPVSAAAPGDAPVFRCAFTAQDGRTPFRAPRRTPRPVVQGPHTARVVGKAGEEIWTDVHGRVKVQFHWDRACPGDEGSSCWLRVAQAWAGARFGAMHLPRMGTEVVVSFLEGDPDRPLVTGQLYDADHVPYHALPANQTRSYLRSHSTKGGGPDDANELRFEDRLGAEQLFLQAQRDYERLVKHDARQTIGNDESHSVAHDRTKSIGHDERVEVKANRTESVGGDESITVTGSRTEAVGKDEAVDVSGSESRSVAKDATRTVGGSESRSVAKDATRTVGGSETQSVAKDASRTVGGSESLTVAKDRAEAVTGGRTATIGKDDALQVGKALLVQAADQIVLQAGSARIVLKKSGDVLIEGANVVVKGSGKITVQASGDVVVKGSNVKNN